MMHAFEDAGLGKPPFICFDAIDLEDTDGKCQCCGTPIRYEFWLRSSDKKEFCVGSTCILMAESKDSPLAEWIKNFHRRVRRVALRRKKLVPQYDALIDHWREKIQKVKSHPEKYNPYAIENIEYVIATIRNELENRINH